MLSFSFRQGVIAAIVSLFVISCGFLAPPTIAMANGVNASVTSSGYIYLQNIANDGIDRYNISTGEVEAVRMTSASCQSLDRNSIYEMAFDASRFRIYWSNFKAGSWPNYRTQINSIDLKTGECQNWASESYVYVANGDYFSFAGIALDVPNQRLYYVDEGGSTTPDPGIWQQKNRTLRYVDLNDTSNNRDHIIELTNQPYTFTVGISKDIVLDGDYVYIVGKVYDAPTLKNSGDGVFKARVTIGNVVANSVEIETLFTNEANNTDIYQVDKRGDNVFFLSWNQAVTGGIYRFDVADPSGTVTQIMPNSWPADDPTGNWKFTGFALGQGNEMFTTDSPPGWGPLVFYSSQRGANPQMMAGTYHPSTYWGLFNYDSELLPASPTVTNVERTSDANARIVFTPSSGADVDGNYLWTATPTGGGAAIIGTCTTSPCTASGLAPGIHYSFSLVHNFRNSVGDVIVQSNKSSEVLDSAPAPASVTQVLTGFPTMKSALSSAQKTTIRTWLTANPSLNSATCVGQVGYNWANVSTATLRSLAKARATAVCNYMKSRKPALTIHVGASVISKSKVATIRKVTVTLR